MNSHFNENIEITIMMVFSHFGMICVTHFVFLRKIKGILNGIVRFEIGWQGQSNNRLITLLENIALIHSYI